MTDRVTARKFRAALGGFFTVLASALADGHLSGAELVAVAAAAASAGAVYVVRNRPKPGG